MRLVLVCPHSLCLAGVVLRRAFFVTAAAAADAVVRTDMLVIMWLLPPSPLTVLSTARIDVFVTASFILQHLGDRG